MLFGLALLAGFVGYAVVDPFNNLDSSGSGAESDGDAVFDESGGQVDTSNSILDDPNAATTDSETGTDDPEVVTDDTETVVDDPDVVQEEPETIIAGTEADDLIYGGDGDYIVNGGDGDDQLHGGDGSSTLNGEAGNDRLYAGDGFPDQSQNTLNGGMGDDVIYGSNEAENNLNGDAGDDLIHIRGHDTATGGTGADSFAYSTEYGDGALSTITDYNADEDQIIVEHLVDETGTDGVPAPEITISVDGLNAVICLDGEECMVVQGAANSLTVEDILLRSSPIF